MITQEQLPMVGIASMNDTHLEEMLIINRLETAVTQKDIEAVSKTLQELIEHTTLHFCDEEKMMEGSLFPELKTHKGEHDRHLHELHSIATYFKEHQDTHALSAYIHGNLIPWFLHHIDTMDTVTAAYLQDAAE